MGQLNFKPTPQSPHPAFTETNISFMASPHTGLRSGVVIACPHAGRHFPNARSFEGRILAPLHELDQRGDTYTDSLIWPGAQQHGVSIVAANIAPTIINYGRALTSIGPNDLEGSIHTLKVDENESFAARGQGLISSTSFVTGKPLFKPGLKRTEHETLSLIREFYAPYHAKLNSLIKAEADGDEPVLVYDVHSYPKFALPGEPDPTGSERPDVLFSNRDGTSCPHALLEKCVQIARDFGYSAAENDPYKGGFTTQEHSMANPQRPHSFTWSLQCEMARAAYGIDEKTLEIIKPEAFTQMQRFQAAIVNTQKSFIAAYEPLNA